MKFICCLLTVYLFCLFSFPCTDEICYSCKSEQTTTAHDRHADGQRDECHDCSPFCVCNACHGSTLATFAFFPEPVKIIRETLVSLYRGVSSEGIPAVIWEPPKLS